MCSQLFYFNIPTVFHICLLFFVIRILSSNDILVDKPTHRKNETILVDIIYIFLHDLFDCTGVIYTAFYTVFYVNVFRSIGQVGEMEFDEIGQRDQKVCIQLDIA